uniref:Cathepsin L1 n=2 Tax=Ciona intestinalis TaxID=7719 RepID=F6T6N4_CIOIN
IMKVTVLLAVVLFAGCCSAMQLNQQHVSLFQTWKNLWKKVYQTVEEEEQKMATWFNNWNKISEHNMQYSLKQKSYRLEMNEYGDLTSEEFSSMMNGYRNDIRLKRKSTGGSTYLNLLSFGSQIQLPTLVDWRKHGLVTPVKNQGQCGSCWSFSATGSLEGQHKKKTGKLVSLSEQNLIDCSTPEGNDGCNGGLMDQAFKYIKIQGGIDTEAYYPYEAKDDTCRFNITDSGATDTGFVDIKSGDEEMLKEAAATVGPISVAIDASHTSFQFYSNGVYSETACSSTMLDHGVLVVGYGTENGKDYWLVKNSWGEGWGEAGYIKMSRNADNQCGIATQASYPLV